MDLSIIINHYQTPHLLKLCLKNLMENLPEDLETEIIITDSKTRKETQEMLTKLESSLISTPLEGRFSLLTGFVPSEKNIGFGRVVNLGLKKVRGKYILIINADIIINKKETIPLMLDYLSKHPKVGLLGPQLLNFNSSIQNSCFRFYTPAVILCRRSFLGKTKWGKKIIDQFLMKDIDKKNPIEVDWLMGSALLARKSAMEKTGLFDERFFMYFEDVDWCRRFQQTGYKVVYFPLAPMYHYHMQASKKGRGIFDLLFSKYTRIHLISAIKYFWKWRKNGRYVTK